MKRHTEEKRRLQPAKLIRLAGLLPLLMTCVSFAGDVYKWKDADGKVHFGDKPNGARAEPVELRRSTGQKAGPALEAARRERTERLLNEYATERSEREEARQKALVAAVERRRRCEEARSEQVELEHSAYLYTRDEKGNKQILPDSELRNKRAVAVARARELCKSAESKS